MLTIRDAVAGDAALLLRFIRALAAYERLSHEVRATEADITRTVFGEPRYARAIIASWNGEPAGFALYFFNFSTFLARPGLYLEDLFVLPEQRDRGIGKALLVELARRAHAADCGRMEWAVLNWNEPAIRFYERLGARPIDEWRTFRLTREALGALAASDAPGAAR
jgi:GNAT superfamily N-acetyltransferase